MNADVVIVLAIIAVAVVLFVTEWVRYDGVALMVLLALAISGVIPMSRAIEGFANPAVVTIAAVLVLSGGLYRTGVANLVGAQVMRLAGDSPIRVTALLMLTAGLMSGVMNNIAATALLLPVALDIARRLGMRASRLLIPLSFGALLGGMTTLIGTGPNILLSTVLERSGEGSFGLFSFTPVGAAALVLGVLYMVLAGRHFLPDRATEDDASAGGVDLRGRYALGETLFSLRIPEDSALDGRSLVQARLGRALGIDLLAVRRRGHLRRAPEPDFQLRGGDILICEGRADAVERLRAWGHLANHDESEDTLWRLVEDETALAKVEIGPNSSLIGSTVKGLDFRNRFQAHIVAIRRGDAVRSASFQETRLEAGDTLLLLGREDRLQQLRYADDFSSLGWTDIGTATREYGLHRWLMRLQIPEGSGLHGETLAASRLNRAFDLTVLEIQRGDPSGEPSEGDIFLPQATDRLRAGDRLIVEGDPESCAVLDALQGLEPDEARPSVGELESEEVGFAEVTLAPSSNIVGKTLAEILFRESYGLSLLAIWRGGRTIHSNIRLAETRLQFGDALLVYGRRKQIALLARDPRFLVLTAEIREVFRARRAPVASAIMAGVILAASLNLLPVYIAALLGALLMVFTGCLKGNEVYPLIEWRVVVLLGGMLALGLAMEESGTAELLAREVIGRAAEAGPRVLIASLFLLCALAAQFVPTSAVAVLVAPIALSTAAELDLSARALLMVVAVGSSCAFLSPFGHPVNLLVMGVGGYKVTDYTRVGAPLFVLLLLLVVFYLPVVWPV
ncbi:SLC13 family permease [Candidatus Palauibacter sp.]|uniref:SLC13 family permease n=1 Tax=Candidatus Palauibacter sp. TaxID=3101350 RepID=UPI003B01815B